jgi:uncharacterized protein YuzE
MKLEFDPLADAAYLELSTANVETSCEIQPGIVADYDENGQIVGIEILQISKRNQPVPIKKAA